MSPIVSRKCVVLINVVYFSFATIPYINAVLVVDI